MLSSYFFFFLFTNTFLSVWFLIPKNLIGTEFSIIISGSQFTFSSIKINRRRTS